MSDIAHDVPPEVIAAIQAAVNSPTGKVKIGPVWSANGQTYYGAQVYDNRKKVGPVILNAEIYPTTPAGALHTLAHVMEMNVDRD